MNVNINKTRSTRTGKPTIEANKYVEELLDLIDNSDKFTRSDLQGIVLALVLKIMRDN